MFRGGSDDEYDLDEALRIEAECLEQGVQQLLGSFTGNDFLDAPPSPIPPGSLGSTRHTVISPASSSSGLGGSSAPASVASPVLPLATVLRATDVRSAIIREPAGQLCKSVPPALPRLVGRVDAPHNGVVQNSRARRRLSKKTPAVLTYWRTHKLVMRRYSTKRSVRPHEWVAALASVPSASWGRRIVELRQQLGLLCMRDLYEALLHARNRKRPRTGSRKQCVREQVRSTWRSLGGKQNTQAFMCNFIIRNPSLLAEVLQRTLGRQGKECGSGSLDVPVHGCLGTWNGRWLMENQEVLTICQGAKDCEEAGLRLRHSRAVGKLAEDFHTFITRVQQSICFDHWSFQIELTPEAFREGRVHIHMFFSFAAGPQPVGARERWRFGHSEPLLVPNKRSGRHNRAANGQGHFYCQADKIGAIVCRSTCPKHSKLLVRPSWVLELYAMRKMSESAFIKELIAARGRAKTIIEDLRWQRQLLDTQAMQEKALAVQMAFARIAKPFKTVPAVEEWRTQYGDGEFGNTGTIRARYKFLVLTGPSQVGKSMFAAQLFPPCHQCFCLGQSEPDLRHYNPATHRSICCEEVEPAMVLANRLLFQAGMQVVTMCQSKCQQHAFSIFVHGVPFILCSNDWVRRTAELPPEGREWLASNSVVVEANEPLYMA